MIGRAFAALAVSLAIATSAATSSTVAQAAAERSVYPKTMCGIDQDVSFDARDRARDN